MSEETEKAKEQAAQAGHQAKAAARSTGRAARDAAEPVLEEVRDRAEDVAEDVVETARRINLVDGTMGIAALAISISSGIVAYSKLRQAFTGR